MDHECKRHPGQTCPIEAEDFSGKEDYVCPLGEVVKVKCCTTIPPKVIPFFVTSESFCEYSCTLVHGIIMAEPDQKPLVEAVVGYVRMENSQISKAHWAQWDIYRTKVSSIYETFLKKHPMPSIDDIFKKRCVEHDLEWIPVENCVEL